MAVETRLQDVLVAVDLSPVSDRVVKRAALLPLAPEARIEIFHVLPPQLPPEARRGAEEGLARLCDLARATASPTVNVTSSTAVGRPYVEIIRRARAIGAGLVVVGRDGEKGLRQRLFSGSTPKRVVRKGDTPFLVVALEPAQPYHRPIVAVDLSESSQTVADLALRCVCPEESTHASLLHAYHVPFEGWIREGGMARRFEEDAATQLKAFHEGLGTHARGWRPILRKGDPRVVILAEATRRGADVVVLGTHGGSGVSHTLLGSVAEWVTEEAACDVLITRPAGYSFELP